MENKNKIEIPFGAKDSELCECEYTIAEGYEAEIKDGKVIIRKVESEDERIRKDIISYFKTINSIYLDAGEPISRRNVWLAWLEKQGENEDKDIETKLSHAHFEGEIEGRDKVLSNPEKYGLQKIADKFEPKFKVGDWVVYCNDDVDLITGIEEKGYCINNGGYIPFMCESDMRLWTIEDAKDGDVLAYRDGQWIFIYKEKVDDNSFCYHTLYSTIHQDLTINDSAFTMLGDATIPATKEQRDLLFKKMKEAGYEWDAEHKQLKKIEQKPVIEMKTSEESLGVDSDTYNKIVDECVYGEQKTAWSVEDEVGLGDAMWAIKQAKTIAKDENDMGNLWYAERWLKSLKGRVRPKLEWSEEDESHIRYLIECLEHCKKGVALTMTTSTSREYINWLKSIKPQSTWKPSEEQLIQLSNASNGLYYNCETLLSLLEQLKAL